MHAVIREILLDAIKASKELGIDKKERKQWEHVLANLTPYKIGRYGQLMEWSVDIDDPKLLAEEKLAVVLGTEGDGLAFETIADCDYTVCIPMAHGVDSLNVAAASAVAFWQLGKSDF